MHRVSRAAIGAALASGVLLLGGCGDSSGGDTASPSGSAASDSASSTPVETPDDAPSTEPTVPTVPTESTDPTDGASSGGLVSCDEVWSAGATLPRTYRGCADEGATVKPDKHTCSFGGALVEYDGRYYAQLGSTINDEGDLAASDGFQQALAACQA